MNTDTYKEIMSLTRMTVGELREKYLEVFGEETRSHHKDFLRKRIAWRLQALAEGDLSERARRRAEELADDADLRIRAPRARHKSGSAEERDRSVRGRLPASRDRRLPLPGTLLVREYKGQSVVVKVLDEGFEYEERLTMNIVLSFAQFEREIIAERTRAKMSAVRRKGKWMGGGLRFSCAHLASMSNSPKEGTHGHSRSLVNQLLEAARAKASSVAPALSGIQATRSRKALDCYPSVGRLQRRAHR